MASTAEQHSYLSYLEGGLDIKTIFNSGVACHAIALADRIGVLQELESRNALLVSSLIRPGISWLQIDALLNILELAQVVSRASPDRVERGLYFEQCLARKSLFTWLFHASAATLVHAADTIVDPRLPLPNRDSALIAAAMADLGRRNIDKILLQVVHWGQYACILDVGCGDASRLQELVRAYRFEGVGLEQSAASLKHARDRIERSPEANRVHLVAGDAKKMDFDASLRTRIDIALMALLAHDLLPAPDAIETLKNWKKLLPNLHTLIVCETVKADRPGSLESVEVPSIGYEYLHALMGIDIETDFGWRNIFQSAGWSISKTISLAVPSNTNIYICDRVA